MSTVTRFLDWLDEAAAGLIRVAYLLAGITAVAVYFGAGHLPIVVAAALDGALPWVLASAVEIHTYLSARRVRSSWQDMQASARSSAEHDKAVGALRVNLGVLALLVAFSAWNQLNYLYDVWTPPHTTLALPGWLAYVIRALVVPAAFMAAAFLAPLALPVAAQIEQEARATLADVFTIARRQRRRMLKSAERDGRDMTGALVELVTDSELRRVIAHAYQAIAPASLGGAIVQPDLEIAPLALPTASQDAPQQPIEPDRPPTGPGSPMPATATKRRSSTAQKRPAILKLETPPEWRKVARGSANTPAVRTHATPARTKAAAVWQPGMSVAALEAAAGISRSTAARYRAEFTAAPPAVDGQAVQ